MKARTELLVSAATVVLLAAAPAISPLVHLDVSIVSEVLVTAIAVMSVNLLLGYTGLPAFGNAAYFGLGTYGAALSVKYAHVHFIEAIVIGTVAALLGGLILAPFLLRRRGIYFGLLSIAFGQVFYFIAYRYTDVTGGEDGMQFPRPDAVLGGAHQTISELGFYYVALALFVLVVIAFRSVVRSPFGRTLVAIRQNEARVRYLGLNTDRFIFVALLISATMAGLSGALFGLLINFAYPLQLDWHQSGYFVLSMILGGAGTVWGSLVGAFIYVIGKDIISTITPLWQIFLGALFVACVLGFPRGILGSIAALRARAPDTFTDDDVNAAFDPNAPVEVGRGA
ncbi:MAG: putative branched-chain amino acid transport permease [Candidatus Eremiobacteraeota bacterium]|nr:putative branched-chain amino acid transport permease [Candidatus Eremiobacteraeota bacterium]